MKNKYKKQNLSKASDSTCMQIFPGKEVSYIIINVNINPNNKLGEKI